MSTEALNGIVTDIGMSISQIAAGADGFYIYPTKFGLSSVAGVLSSSRVNANTMFYQGLISGRVLISPNTIELICSIPRGVTSEIQTIEELYIFIEDSNDNEYLFAVSQPANALDYNPGAIMTLKMFLTINNVTPSSLYQFVYSDAFLVKYHNVNPAAHPDIQRALSNGGIFVNESAFSYIGQYWDEQGSFNKSAYVEGMLCDYDSVNNEYRAYQFNSTTKRDILGIVSKLPGKSVCTFDITNDEVIVSGGIYQMLVTGYPCRFLSTGALPTGLQFTAQVTEVTFPGIGSFSGSEYLLISSPSKDYYVWFYVDSSSTDPNVPNREGIEIDISTCVTANDIAVATAAVLDSDSAIETEFSVPIPIGATITITNEVLGKVTAPSVSPVAPFTVSIHTVGKGPFNIIVDNTVDVSEQTVIDCLAASTLSGGEYFTINTINVSYYVWFNLDSADTDPTPSGLTGVEVELDPTDTAHQVATKLANALNALSTFICPEPSGTSDQIIVTCVDPGTTADASDVDTGFTISTLTQGAGTPADYNRIKIALTEVDAIAGNYIDIVNSGFGTITMYCGLGTERLVTTGFFDMSILVAENMVDIDVFTGYIPEYTDLYAHPTIGGAYTTTKNGARIAKHIQNNIVLLFLNRDQYQYDNVFDSVSPDIINFADKLDEFITDSDFSSLTQRQMVARTKDNNELYLSEHFVSGPIFKTNRQSLDRSIILPSGTSSMSCGPITIESGKTVTIETDAVWTIV